jgi:hypothetical protein
LARDRKNVKDSKFYKEGSMRKDERKNLMIYFMAGVLMVLCMLYAYQAQAQTPPTFDVTLSWDGNSEPDIAGYKVYHGTASRAYTVTRDAGNVITYKITGLTYGQMYYFAVTALDTQGLESDYSNEVFTDGVTGFKPGAPGGLKNIEIEIHRPDGTTVKITVP